jgi:hypothetical protein
MSQWGNNDRATNSVIWGITGFNGAPNTTNQTAFFRNNTQDAFINGITAGQWGVDPTEIAVGNGPVNLITITNRGTGYTANATITFTGGGGSSAAATGTVNTSIGKIYTTEISNAGSSYETNPTIAFSAPTANAFNANSAVTAGANSTTAGTIALASAGAFVAGDAVNYAVAAGNTAIGGLTSGTKYYIQFANATVVALAATSSGSRISLTKGFTETGHTLQGDTATGAATVGGAQNKGVAHAGWVVRTVGTGGRAGRVQYETLVAMGSMSEDIGNDDSVLPDSNG